MPIYYILIVILIVFLVISLLTSLLFNPIFWVFIGLYILYVGYKRRQIIKKMNEYQNEYTTSEEEYYSNTNQNHTSGNDDIIDVSYTVIDEEDND